MSGQKIKQSRRQNLILTLLTLVLPLSRLTGLVGFIQVKFGLLVVGRYYPLIGALLVLTAGVSLLISSQVLKVLFQIADYPISGQVRYRLVALASLLATLVGLFIPLSLTGQTNLLRLGSYLVCYVLVALVLFRKDRLRVKYLFAHVAYLVINSLGYLFGMGGVS